MKNLRKWIALLVCLTMMLLAVNAFATSTDKTYKVGILQLVQHQALDAATKGFRDALSEKLGDKVMFDEQNAQGDPATCATIANSLVSSGVDLILANATPALQAAAAATADIPVLGTSITEYGVALDIKDFNGVVGGNISGTSDLAPLDQQAAMIKELFPNAKTIGLIYCSAEANSLYQVNTVKEYLDKLGYTATLYPFSDSNDLASIATNAVGANEVIYVPTDNTVASNAGIIDNICQPAGIPVVAGEKGICAGCGVATLSIDYYDLGYATGEMAYKVLTGESAIATMPIEYAPKFTKMYNPAICDKLGITVPADYVAIEQ
ncbi:MAG: ABC transporter substrate-binding protein [Candidatus Limiplasma sp.]|nr:ABC transporter substrate-binding protein [Candidatus Limiplasma sp.]